MVNILNKCFWLGHNSDVEITEGNYIRNACSICGTRNFYDISLGVRILSVIKIVGIILLAIIILLLATLLLYSAFVPFDYLGCKDFADQNSIPFIYRFWKGCLVNYRGFWVSPNNLIQLIK